MILTGVFFSGSNVSPIPNPSIEQQWGIETLQRIQSLFWSAGQQQYLEETKNAKPAFAWSLSVQLSALAAAARVDPQAYTEPLRHYADSLRPYWIERNGLGGFAAEPAPAQADRYYDDNAWMTLALLDTYDVTHDLQYKTWAVETFHFVMSGQDRRLGGGIFWRESDHATKNTCVNAPAIVAALRLYRLTGDKESLATAQSLYAWVNAHLQDRDGLYWDNIQLNRQVSDFKWSYNSALMIESNVEFYQVTREPKYLAEAQRIASAAEARWVHTDTGAVVDEAPFAHLLAESFLALYGQDGDRHWQQLAFKAIAALHAQAARASGHYSSRWDDTDSSAVTADSTRLIDWASAANAYWVAARYR